LYQVKISNIGGDNYNNISGTLGHSCMNDKKFFDIYTKNPDICKLLILKIDGKISARALLWKLDSIKIDGDRLVKFTESKPEFFLDRVYAIKDYQITKLRDYAHKEGWAMGESNQGLSNDIMWKNFRYYPVIMSVKVKKLDYGDYPYLDTFRRYDHTTGHLWNDDYHSKGGHILSGTQGNYEKSISKRRIYIKRFKDKIFGSDD